MNDIKNENERLTLPFVPEAVIVGNGDFPSHPFPLAVFDQAPCVVCCDGAANALADSGRVPDLIVGDGDSLSEENRIRFHDRIHRRPRLPACPARMCMRNGRCNRCALPCVRFHGR